MPANHVAHAPLETERALPLGCPVPPGSPAEGGASADSAEMAVASRKSPADDLVSILELVESRCTLVLDGIARIKAGSAGKR